MILRLILPGMENYWVFFWFTHKNAWSVFTQSSSRNKSNFDPRSSSLSLASLHSTCTRENSLERATQSCPTSPTKVPLPLDSPLLSKVRLRCSVSTNVLANEICQEKHRRCIRGLWIRRYNVCEASNENSEELEASELRGRELM